MKTNPDPHDEDPLLEAVLRDDGWQAANAAAKAQALAAFQTRHRLRRLTRWGAGLAALAVMAAAAAYWIIGPAEQTPPRLALKVSEPHPVKYLTDAELLALFPPGSCFLAEVDGQKKLIFYDPKVEREYVSDAGAEVAVASRR
jgi:hypothetical protein